MFLLAVVACPRPALVHADEPEREPPPMPLATATPIPAPVPRFDIEVTGRSPQEALEEQLSGFEVCGSVDNRTPAVDQMAAQRPRPSPSVNLMPVFRLLAHGGKKLFHKKKPARYLVYRIARSESTAYLVHDGLLPEAVRFRPNTVVEVVAVFPDRKSATRAQQRLEQGFPLAQVTSQGCAESGRRVR